VGIEEITTRLKRVEGQVRGLQRMVEEQRDCEAILTQLMAARAALDRVGLLIADDFVERCFTDSVGDVARGRVSRVLTLVFSRFSIPVQEEDLPLDNLFEPSKEEDNHGEADSSN
jgi:DNA-binding FrmR family transcriptional regulator